MKSQARSQDVSQMLCLQQISLSFGSLRSRSMWCLKLDAIVANLADANAAFDTTQGAKSVDMTSAALRQLALLFLICLKNFEQCGQ